MTMVERLNQIDALFAEWDRPDSPGCALGIVESGRLVYGRGYGCANLEHQIPISTQTVFDIASTSKQFTAACIALLIESGQLRLNDPIAAYVPELPAFAKGTITIAHLLYHTSGWRDYLALFELAGYRDADHYTDEEVMVMLSRQTGLNNPPGDAYLYSNANYYLLGLIVQRVSGQSLAEFAQEQIFRPLGMTNTRFQDDHTRIVPHRATGYSLRDDDRYRIDMTTLDMVGDGAVLTSVDDLALWAANFDDNRLGNGGRALIDLLHTRGCLNNGEEIAYALGLEVGRYRGLPMVCHGGWWVGYRSELLRFPTQQTAIICLANSSNIVPEALALRVADVWLEELFTEGVPPATADADNDNPQETNIPLKEYSGDYRCNDLDTVYRLTVEDGRLLLRFGRTQQSPLIPISAEVFQLDEKTFHFAKNKAGITSAFTLNDSRAKGLYFERLNLRG